MIQSFKSTHQFKGFQVGTQSEEDLNRLGAKLRQLSDGCCRDNGAFTRFKKDSATGTIYYGFDKVDVFDWLVLEPGEIVIYSDEDFRASYSLL
jgi:hypothetical protein